MYDFHIHSNFSGDCKYSMEDMVKGAINNNLRIISFTDHIDYDYKYADSTLDFVFEVKDFLKESKRLKAKYKDDIEVLSGVEIGIQPHLKDKITNLIDLGSFDFVIMSLHVVKGKEMHEGEFFLNKPPLQAYTEYYEDLLLSLENFNDFDVVGHLDLVSRYRKFFNTPVEINAYEENITKVFKKIISMDKGIEINTSGIRYGIESFHPSLEILKLYKKLGGEVITIGSDAHKPEDIGYGYKDAISLLKDLGFKNICIFRNRKRQFIKIE